MSVRTISADLSSDGPMPLPAAGAATRRGAGEVWRPGAVADTGRGDAVRAAASPRQIANAVAFLASLVSGYTTGTVLTINGGVGREAGPCS
jgi:Enoyl-(Acyl carrier protein) reductase